MQFEADAYASYFDPALLTAIADYSDTLNVYLDAPGGDTVGLSGHDYATPVSAVPEPSTWAIMLPGFAVLGFMAYRRRRGATLAA